jgi:prevent-host-death family protein
MNRKLPVDQSMKVSEFRSHLNDAVTKVYERESRIVLEKSGVPVAVVVSMEDFRRLKQEDELIRARTEWLEEMRAPFRQVDPDEFQREVDKALEEVRAEMKAERELAAKSAK